MSKPDFLIISANWFNEPFENRPNNMSFQRALVFIENWMPKRETFLIHIGDGDVIPGDPFNSMIKKTVPARALKPPFNGAPYPIPMNQDQWQRTVDRIVSDQGLPFKITLAYDGLEIPL